MNFFSKSLFITILVIGLTACTGSQETPPSTILIIGHGTGQISLVATADLFSTVGSTNPQFLVSRTMTGNALNLDIVDRNNRRNQAVILVGNGETHTLEFFNINNIDPVAFDGNTMFLRSRNNLALNSESVIPESSAIPAPIAFCPSNLQINRTGSYVAIINDQRNCSDLNSTGLIVMDITRDPARIVYHRENNIFPNALYLDQNSEELFYFSEQAGGAQLEKLRLNNLQNEVILTLDNRDRAPALRDLRQYGDNLLVLRNSNYTIINNVFTEDNVSQGNTVESTSGSESFVVDDFRTSDTLYILGNRGLTVHNNLDDDNESIYRLNSTIASYDFANRLIYGARTGNISIFDTLNQQISSRSLDDLNTPTVSAVIQGVITTTNP